MAKKLNILKAGSAVPFADAGLKLSKNIKLSEIEDHPEFKNLYKINSELLERIKDSMSIEYDNSQPVHIWIVIDDNGITHYYLIDGYTRVEAARALGFETIPCFEHKFENFEQAYKYVVGIQVNRRNLDGQELLLNVSKLNGTEFIQNTEGKKSKAIGEVLGVSDRTVEKANFVNLNADQKTKDKIESGELSVNKAYNKLKNIEPKKKKPAEKITDALSDSTGNPAALNFNHSDGIERPYKASSDHDSLDDFLVEKNRQIQAASDDSFVKGFVFASEFILSYLYSDFYKDKNEEMLKYIGTLYTNLFCNCKLTEDLIENNFKSNIVGKKLLEEYRSSLLIEDYNPNSVEKEIQENADPLGLYDSEPPEPDDEDIDAESDGEHEDSSEDSAFDLGFD